MLVNRDRNVGRIPGRAFLHGDRIANDAGMFPPCYSKNDKRNTEKCTAEPHSPYFLVKSDAPVGRKDLHLPRGSDNERANACPFAFFSLGHGTFRNKVFPFLVFANFSSLLSFPPLV